MSQINNTPNIYNQYSNQSLRSPNIEDPNTPDGSLQGKIFTSDLTSADDYSVDYAATIVSAASNISRTGNNYTYSIVVSYTADISGGSATVPGYYGSNLIKANDAFIIESQDYIRGIVNKVEDIVIAGGPTTYTFTYTLDCTILQGDTTTISLAGGQTFKWDRQLYTEKDSFENAYPPRELSSSYNKYTGEAFFYWKNINEYSYSYTLEIRQIGVVPAIFYERINVTGNTANPVTKLTPFVDPYGGAVTTIRIDNPGEDCSSERSIRFIGSGSGEAWATKLDSAGSLRINNFKVYAVFPGTDTIHVYSPSMKEGYWDYPVPNIASYIEGLPAVGNTKDFFVASAGQITPGDNRYLELHINDAQTGLPVSFPVGYTADAVKTHDGVYRIGPIGYGYNNKLRAEVKKIPDNVKYYYDPNLHAVLVPGNTYAWKVSANLDEINKLYTEWTEEQYIKI